MVFFAAAARLKKINIYFLCAPKLNKLSFGAAAGPYFLVKNKSVFSMIMVVLCLFCTTCPVNVEFYLNLELPVKLTNLKVIVQH